MPLHASNLLLVHVLIQAGIEVLPPLKEHGVANELEPRCENQAGVVELLLELLRSDVLCISDLVPVNVEIDVGLDEEDVVNLVLTPLAVAGGLVVDSGEEMEILKGNLLLLDTQLVLKLALSSSLDTGDRVFKGSASLGRDVERMGAASVCPHIGKGDLFGCALLKEELVLVVEEENGKGAVEEALIDVGHEMADLLAGGTDWLVVLVEDDADLIHKTDLLLVMTGERL